MNKNRSLSQSITLLAIATGTLLLIPLIAMQFTDEVKWTLSDFVIAGAFLFGTGFSYLLVTRVLAARLGNNVIYRMAIGFALFTGLLLLWVNGAVGVIGSEDNSINLLYFGVIAVGLMGAFFARFQPEKMVFTMLVMAFAQALVAAIALVGGYYQTPPTTVLEIIAVNGFFITLFTVSALVFRHVALENPGMEKLSME